MKYVILILMIIWTWMLMSCQETIYVELPGKTDTVKQFTDRVFAGLDSTEIPVIVPVKVPTRQQDSIVYVTEYDTVYVYQIDSIFVERTKIVYVDRVTIEMDTLYLTRILYDTLWRSSTRLVHYIPSEVLHIVQQFYADAEAHGKAIKTHYVDIRFKHLDAVEQARSYQVDDQWKLFVNDNLTFSEMYLPIYREMARIQFGKEYSQDPSSVLYPFFNANTIRWDNRAQFQTEVNQFFQ